MTTGAAPSMLPPTPDLLALAERVVWFKEPTATLANVPHFVAHAMTYGTHADIAILRRYMSDAQLRAALDAAPAGVFDARSWTYWNLKLDRPLTPLPRRRLA